MGDVGDVDTKEDVAVFLFGDGEGIIKVFSGVGVDGDARGFGEVKTPL